MRIPITFVALLGMSIKLANSTQVGILVTETFNIGGADISASMRVVCDDDADFLDVEADGGCSFDGTKPPQSCTADVCGGTFTGTMAETNDRGCNSATSASEGDINGIDRHDSRCERVDYCNGGVSAINENGWVCTI